MQKHNEKKTKNMDFLNLAWPKLEAEDAPQHFSKMLRMTWASSAFIENAQDCASILSISGR